MQRVAETVGETLTQLLVVALLHRETVVVAHGDALGDVDPQCVGVTDAQREGEPLVEKVEEADTVRVTLGEGDALPHCDGLVVRETDGDALGEGVMEEDVEVDGDALTQPVVEEDDETECEREGDNDGVTVTLPQLEGVMETLTLLETLTLVDDDAQALEEVEILGDEEELTVPLTHADTDGEKEDEALSLGLCVTLEHADGEGVALEHALLEKVGVRDCVVHGVAVTLVEVESVGECVRLPLALVEAQSDGEMDGEVEDDAV